VTKRHNVVYWKTNGKINNDLQYLMIIGLPSTSAATAELVVPRPIPTDRPNAGALLLPGATGGSASHLGRQRFQTVSWVISD